MSILSKTHSYMAFEARSRWTTCDSEKLRSLPETEAEVSNMRHPQATLDGASCGKLNFCPNDGHFIGHFIGHLAKSLVRCQCLETALGNMEGLKLNLCCRYIFRKLIEHPDRFSLKSFSWSCNMKSKVIQRIRISRVFWSLSLPVPQRGATAGELLHDGGKVNFEEVDFQFPHNVLMFVVVWLMCSVFLSAIVSVSCFFNAHICSSLNSPSCICHDGGSRRAIVFWCRVFILDWKNCQWIGGTKKSRYNL